MISNDLYCIKLMLTCYYTDFQEVDIRFQVNLYRYAYWDSCRWHDAGTYDAKTKTGGPNGSIRNEVEYKHAANSGLKKAIDLCGWLIRKLHDSLVGKTTLPQITYERLIAFVLETEEVKAKHPKVTYADLYQVRNSYHLPHFYFILDASLIA